MHPGPVGHRALIRGDRRWRREQQRFKLYVIEIGGQSPAHPGGAGRAEIAAHRSLAQPQALGNRPAADQRPMPDWAWVHRELRRPNVTLALLWEEYRAGAPDGFGYSWFCDLYRGWAGRLKPTMRQIHLAGEKLFVDFAGRTGEGVDANTGEIVAVH